MSFIQSLFSGTWLAFLGMLFLAATLPEFPIDVNALGFIFIGISILLGLSLIQSAIERQAEKIIRSVEEK